MTLSISRTEDPREPSLVEPKLIRLSERPELSESSGPSVNHFWILTHGVWDPFTLFTSNSNTHEYSSSKTKKKKKKNKRERKGRRKVFLKTLCRVFLKNPVLREGIRWSTLRKRETDQTK